MGMVQTQRYCKVCGRKTLHARIFFSDGIGCIITLLTVGLFLPIWLLIKILEAFKPWRCQNCGQGRLF